MTTLGDAPDMSTAPVIDASALRNRKAQTFAVVGFAKNGDTNDIADHQLPAHLPLSVISS